MSENPKKPDRRSQARSCLAAAAIGILMLIWLALSIPLAWPALSAIRDVRIPLKTPQLGGTNYLIVASPALQTSAGAWAEYRRSTGYIPRILTIAETETDVSLKEKIQTVYTDSGRPYPFFVLLLGHAHPDSSAPGAYLPAATLDSGDMEAYLFGATTIASDSMYAAQADTVHLLPLAIGRVPARNDGEALRVLARVKQYESQPPTGEGRTRVDLITSASGFGPEFDALAENLMEYFATKYLPEYLQWSVLNGNPDSVYYLPPKEFTAAIAGRLNGDSLLVMYIGHGMADYLGPIRTPQGEYVEAFTANDLSLVRNADRSIVTLIGCLIGQYDLAGDQASLAEMLLLQPGGAAATYAASRITSAEGNTFNVMDLLTGILQDRIPTAGEWVRHAEAGFTDPGSDRAIEMALSRLLVPELYRLTSSQSEEEEPDIPRDMYYNLGQHAYNLFGDPALGIDSPVPDLSIRPAFPWLPKYSSVEFSGSGALPPGASATVFLLAPPGRLWSNDAASGPNDRTVAKMSVTIGEGGRFSGRLELPDQVPGGRYILKVVGVENGITRVGSRTVFLGGLPVGAVVVSLEFWWIVLSLILMWNLRFLPARFFRKVFPRRAAGGKSSA